MIPWIAVGFLSGSTPFAIIIGEIFSTKDIRNVGDGNPGAANAWKSGGWIPGMIALSLDILKGFLPVYFAIAYWGHPTDILSQIIIPVIALAPIVGHAWSPILDFNGGKALATTWGAWIALTNGLALPVGMILLGLAYIIQKNDAITVTTCLIGFLLVFLPLKELQLHIFLFWILNMAVVIWKHRLEYLNGITLRDWTTSITRIRS